MINLIIYRLNQFAGLRQHLKQIRLLSNIEQKKLYSTTGSSSIGVSAKEMQILEISSFAARIASTIDGSRQLPLNVEIKEKDSGDLNHGERATEFIELIRNKYLSDLTNDQIEKLKKACALHTNTLKTGDPTIDA
ncbi:MAG: hypothetical protein II973_10665, partial [Spirochaetaceae bacterium]|nr:hypothetical protein [Spirochaetaceae bacterium]